MRKWKSTIFDCVQKRPQSDLLLNGKIWISDWWNSESVNSFRITKKMISFIIQILSFVQNQIDLTDITPS